MKRLLLVTSPPACGKTYISKKLAENLKHVVYLDKDSLIVLSKQIFVVAREEYNRSSPFFEKYIRDFEYDAIIAIAMEALEHQPVARTLLGARVGDLRRLRTPKGAEEVEVVAIRYPAG